MIMSPLLSSFSLLVFLGSSSVGAADSKPRKLGKTSKTAKGGPSNSCLSFPKEIIEPSLTDIDIADEMIWVWQGNPLCAGSVYNETDPESCDNVGSAYGVCTYLSEADDAECDSADTWELLGADGENLGTLISQGVTGVGTGSPVVGGTDCFEGAGGTISSERVEVDGLEMWKYDLSNVKLA